jgi:P-type Ca2+ transporter type 2C
VETLGAATVLCVDKTGTLTLNRMAVRAVYAQGELLMVPLEDGVTLPDAHQAVVEFSVLASEVDPHDPMEQAFHDLSRRVSRGAAPRHVDWTLVREYPLAGALLAHGHGWAMPGSDTCRLAVKGAPEAIAELCGMSDTQRVALYHQVELMAGQGLRVLGVARAPVEESAWPPSLREIKCEFLGLAGLADPVRPNVAAALKDCYGAGMRVVMITGDYPATACAIARQIGLAGSEKTITGAELDNMDDAELRRRVSDTNIFARVVPEQKLRLVLALKANGEVVAMTGDGVNDAPALKAADIGIAMGGRGTDVAREAASLVLLDDDFASIVRTAHLGRRIYDNIRNAMCYLVAVHVPIAGMSLLPLAFGWPLVFFPAHIVFLEFVINPACSIVFEAEDADAGAMLRPPRAPDEPLIGGWTFFSSLLQGISVWIAVAAVFGFTLSGGSEEQARAMAFTTIVLGNLGLIFANRSRSRLIAHALHRCNPALWWVVGATLVGLGLVLYVPYLRHLFRFAPLHGGELAVCVGAALIGLLWFELYKIGTRRQAVPHCKNA